MTGKTDQEPHVSLAQSELKKRGGIKSVLQLLSKTEKSTVQENLILILSNCTFEENEVCVETVENEGLELIRKFMNPENYSQEIVLATTSILANCAAAEGVEKDKLVSELFASGMLVEVAALVRHPNLRIANEACLCLGNFAYDNAEVRDRLGCIDDFLSNLVSLLEALFSMELRKQRKRQVLDSLLDETDTKVDVPDDDTAIDVILENVAGTISNFVDDSTDNVQVMYKANCIDPLICFLEQSLPVTSEIVSSPEYQEDPESLHDNGLCSAEEAVMNSLVQCVEFSSAVCEQLSNTPVDENRGIKLCIQLLSDARFTMQQLGVRLLAELCNCGVKSSVRDRVCQVVRGTPTALVVLTWMVAHESHETQVSAKRCVEALLRYGGKSKRAIYLQFIIQGVIPVLHQLTALESHNVASFATKILADMSNALDMEFLGELMDMLTSTASGTTQQLQEEADLGGEAAKEAIEALKFADADAAGHIATAIVHLCFGADVIIRQEFLSSDKGLAAVLGMLGKSETRGAAMDFFYAIEAILPQPDPHEIEETASEFDMYVERTTSTLGALKINGSALTTETFDDRSSQTCDFCFKLGPKRKNMWAHRQVLFANGTQYIQSMMGKVSREIAMDAPKSIANHIGQEDYVNAFEVLLYYMYFPDGSNEFLGKMLVKQPNLPFILLQLTIQHDAKLIRQQVTLFLRQLLSEENALECFKAALKASVLIHKDDTHIPNAKAPIDMSVESLRNDCFSFILEGIMPILRSIPSAEEEVMKLFKTFVLQVLA